MDTLRNGHFRNVLRCLYGYIGAQILINKIVTSGKIVMFYSCKNNYVIAMVFVAFKVGY